MTDLQIFYDHWGLLVVLLVSFAEFAGAPVAAVPVLILAGVLGPQVGEPFWMIPAVATVGALFGEALWFWLARSRSKVITDRACGLSANPWACVTILRRKVLKAGTAYFVFSKFIPGTGNLIASAAGLAGLPALRFLALDAVSLLLWATLWSAIGWVGSGPASRFQPLLENNLMYAIGAVVVLMLLTGVWRVHKVRLHKGLHVRDGGAR